MAPDDLIDLPLGEDGGEEPTFPKAEYALPPPSTASAKRRKGGRKKRRRPFAAAWWLLLLPIFAIAAWLYLRPPLLTVSPQDPAPVTAVVGQVSDPIEVEFSNPGRREVAIDDIRVRDNDAFSIQRRDCADLLGPGEACAVQVTFAPTTMGDVSAALELLGGQRGGSTEIELRGEGLGARMVAAVDRVDFGQITVDGESSAQEIEISNQGTYVGAVGSVRVAGDADFRVVANGCRSELAPGSSCRIQLVFAPRRLGDREATLVADSDIAQPLAPLVLVGRGRGPGFEMRPAELKFEPTKVGTSSSPLRVTWVNQGTESWTLLAPAVADKNFTVQREDCSRGSVPVGESCSAEVVFAPPESGMANAELILKHRSGESFPAAELSGTATAAELAFDLRRLGFAAVPIGRSSPPRNLRLSNNGSAAAELSSIGISGGGASSFTADHTCGARLEPQQACVVSVRFRPSGSATATATLQVESDAPASPLGLEVTGSGASAKLDVSRQRLDFATVPQGESQDLQLTIGNGGSAPLEILALDVTGQGFSLRSNPCASGIVGPGSACDLVVRFQPPAQGAFLGEISIRSQVGEQRVALSGLAGEPPVPRASIDRRNVTFEATRAGGRSPVETVTLTSHGPGRLELRRIEVDGGNGAIRMVPATCGDLDFLVADGRCTIGVRLQASTPGTHRATLVIRTNAEGGTIRVPLEGEAY